MSNLNQILVSLFLIYCTSSFHTIPLNNGILTAAYTATIQIGTPPKPF